MHAAVPAGTGGGTGAEAAVVTGTAAQRAQVQRRAQQYLPAGTGGGTGAKAAAVTGTAVDARLGAGTSPAAGAEVPEGAGGGISDYEYNRGRKLGAGISAAARTALRACTGEAGAEVSAVTNTAAQRAQAQVTVQQWTQRYPQYPKVSILRENIFLTQKV